MSTFYSQFIAMTFALTLIFKDRGIKKSFYIWIICIKLFSKLDFRFNFTRDKQNQTQDFQLKKWIIVNLFEMFFIIFPGRVSTSIGQTFV